MKNLLQKFVTLTGAILLGFILLAPAIAQAQDAGSAVDGVSGAIGDNNGGGDNGGNSGGDSGGGSNKPGLAGKSDNAKAVCQGVGLTGTNCDPDTADKTVQGIVATVIKILSILIGVVSVIMIIIGGFKYVTSTGDSNSVNSAKNTILYALIGLAIAAMAQIIVAFVLTKL